MRRREFIALLGGATATLPLVARAQQSDQLRRIAVLGDTPSVWGVWIAAFTDRLHELGWIEGRTVAIDYRWSEGRPERVAQFAAEFVQQKVDVIVTYGGAVTILKQATNFHPHGLCTCSRSSWHRPRRKPFAPGGQCHRAFIAAGRKR